MTPPRSRAPIWSTERLPELVDLYLADLVGLELKPRTIRTYRGALLRMAPLLIRVTSASELLRELVALKPTSRALYLGAARGFERWAVAQGHRPQALLADPRVRVRLDETLPRPLLAAEQAKVETHVAHAERRLRLLYLVLRFAGLRIDSEALALRWRQVELTPGNEGLTIRRTKGRKDRHVPIINNRLLAELRRQRPVDTGAADAPVFPANPWPFRRDVGRRPWSYRAALTAWSELCSKAGVKATPHQLRHTLATELGLKMNPFELRQFFGWKKLEQAARYCAATETRAALKRAYDA